MESFMNYVVLVWVYIPASKTNKASTFPKSSVSQWLVFYFILFCFVYLGQMNPKVASGTSI